MHGEHLPCSKDEQSRSATKFNGTWLEAASRHLGHDAKNRFYVGACPALSSTSYQIQEGVHGKGSGRAYPRKLKH